MKSENSIKTDQLLIRGNIICWFENMIQLSNVSYISTSQVEALEYPSYLIYVIVVGFLSLYFNKLVGFVVLIIALVLSYLWMLKNDERETKSYLTIATNSGDKFRIIISDRTFLYNILKVLEQIIIEGGVGERNVTISILGCNISGNADVLNNFKM